MTQLPPDILPDSSPDDQQSEPPDADTARWLGYIGIGIVLTAMVVGIVVMVATVGYFARNAFTQ